MHKKAMKLHFGNDWLRRGIECDSDIEPQAGSYKAAREAHYDSEIRRPIFERSKMERNKP